MLAICVSLLAAAAEAAEPGLSQTQEAAARAAAGLAVDDVSRLGRARNSHWAPQLRGQANERDDVRSRVGEFRLAPLRENDVGASRGWAVMLSWDFSQVIFAREETQLALAHAHLARVRRDVATQAAELWIERRQARALWLLSQQREACFALLRLTAELDTLTAGLFRDALAREEAACAAEEKK